MVFLAIDVGTTAIKAQALDEEAHVLASASCEYETIRNETVQEIDVQGLKKALFAVLEKVTHLAHRKIRAICVSSLGEAFVPVDSEGRPLGNARLNSDRRGIEECQELTLKISPHRIAEITGAYPNSMYSLPKMMYYHRHEAELFAKTEKFLCIGDYVGFLLTGMMVCNDSLAARTMALDIHTTSWSKILLDAADIPNDKFPRIVRTGEIIGPISEIVKEKYRLSSDCQLVAGGHDQVCAALGAGVVKVGQCNDGTGTVECLTLLFSDIPTDDAFYQNGYCVVPYVIPGTYVTYAFNLTAGALLKWFRDRIDAKTKVSLEALGIDYYEYLGGESVKRPTGLWVLPYFAGAATPYMDSEIPGAIVGLGLNTSSIEIFFALMEGATYDMRLNLEKLASSGLQIEELTATGGGAKSQAWIQIKADILHKPIFPLKAQEGGIMGCFLLMMKATGAVSSLTEAVAQFVHRDAPVFLHDELVGKAYDSAYQRYRKLYPAIKEVMKS